MNINLLTSVLIDSLGSIRGRKAYQKLIYFSKVLGIPVTESYKMYYYGPYSEQIAHELDECISNGILAEEGYCKMVAGNKVQEILNNNKEEIEEYKDKINDLKKYFSSCTPLELEILATVHFIHKSMKYLYKTEDRDKVIEEVKKAKYPKFDMPEINKAYDQLVSYNLLS